MEYRDLSDVDTILSADFREKFGVTETLADVLGRIDVAEGKDQSQMLGALIWEVVGLIEDHDAILEHLEREAFADDWVDYIRVGGEDYVGFLGVELGYEVWAVFLGFAFGDEFFHFEAFFHDGHGLCGPFVVPEELALLLLAEITAEARLGSGIFGSHDFFEAHQGSRSDMADRRCELGLLQFLDDIRQL
jgi:hypothetical protein